MNRIVMVVALVLAATASALGHQITHKALTIVHPWVPETEAKDKEVRVSMRVKNVGRLSDRLLRAQTPVAEEVIIQNEQGQPIASTTIRARSELSLTAKGDHILLRGLRQPLRAYDTFRLTLVFEKAGSVPVDVTVEDDSYR